MWLSVIDDVNIIWGMLGARVGSRVDGAVGTADVFAVMVAALAGVSVAGVRAAAQLTGATESQSSSPAGARRNEMARHSASRWARAIGPYLWARQSSARRLAPSLGCPLAPWTVECARQMVPETATTKRTTPRLWHQSWLVGHPSRRRGGRPRGGRRPGRGRPQRGIRRPHRCIGRPRRRCDTAFFVRLDFCF